MHIPGCQSRTNMTNISGDGVYDSTFYNHNSYSHTFFRSIVINKLLSGGTTVFVHSVLEHALLSPWFLYKSSFYVVRLKCIHLPLEVDFCG